MLLTTPLGTREALPCIGATNGGWRGFRLRWYEHSHLLTPCQVIKPSPSKLKLQYLMALGSRACERNQRNGDYWVRILS
jgi:hypothetical protein